MDYKTQFIKNLKDYRKQNNLTQDDLAEMLGYSQKNIAKWEQGFTLPSVDVLIELSNKMGISLDNLLGLRKETILEQCVDYVIEVQGLERETIITYEDGEETIEENVYGNILTLCVIFVGALVQKESFKDLAQRVMCENRELAIEFLKNNMHIVEENGEWVLSDEFALECFNFCESELDEEIFSLKRDIAEYNRSNKKSTKIEKEIEDAHITILEVKKREMVELLKTKEEYFRKK